MESPLHFDQRELALLQDKTLFPLRNNITQKLIQLLQSLQEQTSRLEAFQQFPWPAQVDTNSGKISKGQHYRAQPYLMLDFPRCFNKSGVMALRTFFWWGNYFGLFLQISGSFWEKLQPQLSADDLRSLPKGTTIDTGTDEWLYNLNETVDSKRIFQREASLGTLSYLKLGTSLPLDQYDHFEKWAIQAAESWMKWLQEPCERAFKEN